MNLEALEDRLAPALMVTSAADDGGAGTLRQVLTTAPANSTIDFDPKVFGQDTTILLTQGEIGITANNLTLQNTTGHNITINAQNNANNTSRILDFTDPNNIGLNETISNLIFANGNAPGGTEPHPGEGGAIYDVGSLTLTNDTFNQNTAAYNGGAVYNQPNATANTLTVTGAKFTGNSVAGLDGSGGYGGAIYSYGGSNVLVHGGGFTGNNATKGGGAIYAVGPAGTVLTVDTQTSFVDNQVSNGNGGAISTNDKLTLTQDTFNSNQSSQSGGAVYDNDSNDAMQLTNDTFTGNKAVDGGAVERKVSPNTGSLSDAVNGCLFYNNQATLTPGPNYGGGLDIQATMTGSASYAANITNSTFYLNTSGDYGGGMSLSLSNTGTGNNTVTLTSLTVYDNTAYNQGGGVWANLSSTGTSPVSLVLHNSIIAGNTIENPVSDGPDILVAGLGQGAAQFISSGYNLIGIADDGTGHRQYDTTWQGSDLVGLANAPQVPSLDPTGLQWNGGPTQTIKLVPPGNGLPGGGYQQGDPTLAGTTDQRGYTRTKPVSIGAEDPGATLPG